MRNLLLGIALGLALGASGAWTYTHYLGEGKALGQTQTQLASAQTTLAQTAQDTHELKSENDSLSAQVQQLSSGNQALKQQVAELKNSASPTVATGPAAAANPFAGIVKEALKQQRDEKLLLLKSRLHLTPQQEAILGPALDAEDKEEQDMTAKMMQGGKIDMTALTKDVKDTKSVDQTLDEILTPDQKTAYAQMKTDQKTSAAETMAGVEMNQFAPLLQLTDAQKDKVYNALYQTQINNMDPQWIAKNSSGSSNPASIIDSQAKAKEDALAAILTPDQLAIYHKQAQAQLDMQKAMMQKFMSGKGTAVPGMTDVIIDGGTTVEPATSSTSTNAAP